MTTRAKTAEEHVRIALEFLEHSDREFAAGDALQGSEKLWGAASRAITAIAMKRNLRHGKYNARVAAVDRLAEEYDEPPSATSFSVAQKFQANFYRDFMEDEEIARDLRWWTASSAESWTWYGSLSNPCRVTLGPQADTL